MPVLVMTLGFSRHLSAVMIPSRQAGDILSGMWQLINQVGRVPKALVWDREAAIGGNGKLSAPTAAFAGKLAIRIKTRQAWAAQAAAARREGFLSSAIADIAVHKGEQESDEANALWRYVRELWENASYPERAGVPEDVPLIEQLVAASTRELPSGGHTISELYMAQALLT